MKRLLLVLAACAAVTTAFAQPQGPGYGRDRYRYLDPEVRQALRHYCQIMRNRHERNNAVAIPPICYRLFRGRP